MDTKLLEKYKRSLYEEVYRTERPGQSVVVNTLDETLCMKKELTAADIIADLSRIKPIKDVSIEEAGIDDIIRITYGAEC